MCFLSFLFQEGHFKLKPMKFIGLNNRELYLKNPKKYLIDWKKKSRSKFQYDIKQFLKPYWEHDIVFEEFRLVGTRMTFDFYNANKKIMIEAQGEQHTKFIKFFHGNRLKYLQQLKRDNKKLEFCEKNNLKLMEIYPTDMICLEFFENQGIYL